MSLRYGSEVPMRATTTCVILIAAVSIAPAASPAPDWAVAVFPSGAEFSLEIAATPEARAMGYMFRERIGAGEGMLFLFDTPERHGFWMKNCRVSLDIIWLSESLQVLEIAHKRPPCPEDGECLTIQPMRPAKYVLEVAGGTALRESLEAGQHVVILAEPALR